MADSPYVGTWKAVNASYSGIEMSVESIIGGEMTFELKDNGKCVLNVAGEEESGKWSENEDGFNVEDQFDFKVDGDKATMDYSGVTITLGKTVIYFSLISHKSSTRRFMAAFIMESSMAACVPGISAVCSKSGRSRIWGLLKRQQVQ